MTKVTTTAVASTSHGVHPQGPSTSQWGLTVIETNVPPLCSTANNVRTSNLLTKVKVTGSCGGDLHGRTHMSGTGRQLWDLLDFGLGSAVPGKPSPVSYRSAREAWARPSSRPRDCSALPGSPSVHCVHCLLSGILAF